MFYACVSKCVNVSSLMHCFIRPQELLESGEIIPTGPDASRPQQKNKFAKVQQG